MIVFDAFWKFDVTPGKGWTLCVVTMCPIRAFTLCIQ